MSSKVSEKIGSNYSVFQIREEITSKDRIIKAQSETIVELFREQHELEKQMQAIAEEEQILHEQGNQLANRIDHLNLRMERIQQSQSTGKEIAGIVIGGLIATGIAVGAIFNHFKVF